MKTKKATTLCSKTNRIFKAKNGKKIELDFKGGDITSDAGVILLEQAEKRLNLLVRASLLFEDNRRKNSCEHSILSMLKQRVYAIALGYEDLNDHDTLRSDLALQTTVGSEKDLASRSTLSRFENQSDGKLAAAIHQVMFQQFTESFESPPKELILDFDATDDTIHGQQEKAYYHGYYGNYCFLPLYVSCGKQLLVSYLRSSKQDGAKHAWAILSLLVKGLKKKWPEVKIIFRGDSGFCRHKMFDWCEKHEVGYITGIAKNRNITALASPWIEESQMYFDHTQEKQRVFGEFQYQAKTWSKKRRVIIKAENLELGPNPRCIVTNLEGSPQELYEKMYCARGEMENRIKEQQLDLFADRTSCQKWWPNQFRLLLSSLAYVLMNFVREVALKGSKLASASIGSIRLKLLKIGAIILRNTRRIRFHLSTAYPYQSIFLRALDQIGSG